MDELPAAADELLADVDELLAAVDELLDLLLELLPHAATPSASAQAARPVAIDLAGKCSSLSWTPGCVMPDHLHVTSAWPPTSCASANLAQGASGALQSISDSPSCAPRTACPLA